MAELLEGVAKAGSWATWMGVFQPGWMELLKEGGMGHSRARRLTTRLSRVISECRARSRKGLGEDHGTCMTQLRVADAFAGSGFAGG